MKKILGCRIIKILLTIIFFAVPVVAFPQKASIIEFGWDYPDVNELDKRLDSMQGTPFDGICFSYQKWIMEAFDTMTFLDRHFEFDKLKSLKWGKYKENYCILRGYGKTGGNWFDDKAWLKIKQNMNNLSKAIFVGKLKGILFDPEYYLPDSLFNPWTYSQNQYPNHSFEEVQNKVRKRGKEFITALQEYTVDFNLLSIWISSLLVEDLKVVPLKNARHVMLLPFFEGILLGKGPKIKIIDGNEYAYWNTRPSQFLDSKGYLQQNTIELVRSKKAKKLASKIETSQPVYYDGLLARHISFDRGIDIPLRWKWLEENLKLAIATSTSNIVWFYNERVDWWKTKVNDTLVSILENCKNDFFHLKNSKITNAKKLLVPKCPNINTGKVYFYKLDPKQPMSTGNMAFTFMWDGKNKILNIKGMQKLPTSISLYINNILVKTFNPKTLNESLKVNDSFKNGRLAVLARYEEPFEAFGLLEQ